ncbi:glycoside hydrolase family 20 protein [Fistulina hepatica ATCC 64428]|uniref:Beta-hexosaminidase n=1 Tax=Fistulina hepatica ATCC 64428 TaxID=1128425 RepID=A0A0D7ALH6_9AGAR|nr:glycoside hydrolase family 20 protein [Fistulina hepatica ATCC 64428]
MHVPLSLTFLLIVAHTVLALWPLPNGLSNGTKVLRLSSQFSIVLEVDNAPTDVQEAVDRTLSSIEPNQLIAPLVVGRASADNSSLATAADLSALVLLLTDGATVHSIAEEAVLPIGTRDESYSLTVPSDGSNATLVASTTLGLLRGLTTFQQLWYTTGVVVYARQTPVTVIDDNPDYPYRGFMLDTARNFFPKADILRTLDAMSFVKLNTFHWHVSFPLEVAEFPELSLYGAYSTEQIYSTSDVQEIVEYAAKRGIDVLMEIDNPGHTSAIGMAYPEYVACYDASPWSTYAGEPPAGQLRFSSDETTNFTVNLLTTVARNLSSSLFSTGGDELNIPCYTDDSLTQQELADKNVTLAEALEAFTQVTHGALKDIGKTPVVWEEMVLDYNITLSNETIVMIWISSEDAASVAAKNFRIIQAPSDYFYLDCGAGGWLGDDPSGNSWCDPFKTWQKAYTFDPLANLTSDQTSLVLGGEQLLWTEQSSPENLDPIVWPRAAVAGEVFWTQSASLDIETALPRLHDLRYRLVQRGVRAIALQPEYCALRPGACD